MITTTKLSALLIINPKSRNGSETAIQDGINLLNSAGIEVLLKVLTPSTTATQLIETYHRKVQLVIIGGGDGTINSALEKLYEYQLRFAILPLGTANDLARTLGVPTDINAAFDLIAQENVCRINLGKVNGKYFLNAAHIGLGVKVTRELTPDLKKKWGVFSYLKAVIKAFKNNKKFRAVLQTGEKNYVMKSIQLAVGNGRYYGGGNIVDERSEIDDGQLCLYSIYPLTFWQLLTCAPLLRFGKHQHTTKTFTLSAQKIDITTSPPLDIHADGEHISRTPAKFEVIPNALEVICAKD
ncbi:MAG TPA: lipid kinase [Cellvibrio sp.]|nr:lipid kinase [Cellvibrio sp.]